MQIVAQSLLVLKITHNSALALGTVSLAQAISFFLFALVGGSFADRIDKRRLLFFTQSLSMILAFVLGVLTLTGVVQVWMIVVIAFCSGTVLSFDQPTRSALIPVAGTQRGFDECHLTAIHCLQWFSGSWSGIRRYYHWFDWLCW